MNLLGKVVKQDEYIYILLPEEKKAYKVPEVSGKKLQDFLRVYDPILSIKDISQKSNLTENEVIEIINELKSIGFYSEIKKKKNLLLVTDLDLNLVKKHLGCFNNELNLSITSIANFNSNLEDIDLIIALSFDNNHDFYEKVEEVSLMHQISWFHASIASYKLYLGPIFFVDGGPCLQCYQTRMKFNEKNKEHIFNPKNTLEVMLVILKNYFMNFQYKMNDSSIFSGREISIDLTDFSSDYTRILKMPLCQKCIEKKSRQVINS